MTTPISTNKDNKSVDEEEVFYHDLDENKSHKSCCTCQTMIIGLLIILIISAGAISYLYWQINQGKIFQKNTPSTVTAKDVENKINNIKPEKNNEFQLALSAAELTALMSEGLTTEKFLLRDVQVSVNPQNMLIYGSLIKPISSKIVITATPVVKNDQIKLVVNNIAAGNINLPAVLVKSSSDTISSFLDQKLENLYHDYKIDKIILKENQLIITGRKKPH